jgi:two-component system chemotaxis response regulator CheY
MAQILVVDDSDAVRNEVSSFLSGNGFTVATAVDGKDGLDKVKANPDLKLVFADVNMPNMDGLTMIEKIRGELGNSSVSIIMLTTESDPKMKERAKNYAVKGWIVKPFNGANVLGAVKGLLGG